MRIAYVNYGMQSGVTPNIVKALSGLGHEIEPVDPTPVLALRDRRTGLPRPTPRVLTLMALSLLRHGAEAYHHRWNTIYAFDQHTRYAGILLNRLKNQPDVVLQNGALFAPGNPPPYPYVLLVDNTCRLAERRPAFPQAGVGEHIKFAGGWIERERAAFQNAAGIATFSEVVRRSLIEEYGVPAERIVVTRAGANIFPRELVRTDDGETLVFVGTDAWRGKGGPALLRAFEVLRPRHPRLRVLLAGPLGTDDDP